jgi:hypothetical protein
MMVRVFSPLAQWDGGESNVTTQPGPMPGPGLSDPHSIVAVCGSDRESQPSPADLLMCQELTEKKSAANRADRSRAPRAGSAFRALFIEPEGYCGAHLASRERAGAGAGKKKPRAGYGPHSGFSREIGVWTAANRAATESKSTRMDAAMSAKVTRAKRMGRVID